MDAPQAEWRKSSDFAEIAEALRVTMLDVCAAWSTDGQTTHALYTAEGDAHGFMLHGVLVRDESGILIVVARTVTNLTVESMMTGSRHA